MSEEIKEKETLNFIEEIIEKDLAEGKNDGMVHTRFPPEPNGYLHIGHSKAICLNFGLAEKYNGKCNLRFDDTNPVTEETEYVDSILADVRWLGFEPDSVLYASDYFDQLYEFAIDLIKKGKAYVDDSSAEEMAKLKGTPTRAGENSLFRSRSVEENLDLFTRMKNGEFPEGSRVLRAIGEMASPNMIMRDPVLYRIKFAHHHRTGDKWCIYPLYDMAHGQSDSIENITHSICTLEFMPHRELYDWCIDNLEIFPSKQYEFARLNLNYTVMSKRKLKQLVEDKHVNGWDDPRMPTISGMRRRGYPAEAIRNFVDRVGIAKRENMIDIGLLEFSVREVLNKTATRAMGVLDPLKVTITNYPEEKTEWMETVNNPEDPAAGTREIPFSRELWIEKEDFMEDPPKKFFRLGPGRLGRLKSGYIIQVDDFKKDENGEVNELLCTYFPESRSGSDTSGLKPKATLHWVSAEHAIPAEVRLYDRLFIVENPAADERDFKDLLNSDSLIVNKNAMLEPCMKDAKPGDSYQFFRLGYFTPDPDSAADKLVFNRAVTLKDAWAKAQRKD